MTLSRFFLFATILLTVVPASAETIGVDLLGAWTDPRSSGNIRRLDATVTYAPRVKPEIGITVFLNRSLAMSISETRGRMPLTLRQNASAAGRSTVLMTSRTGVLNVVRRLGNFDGYAGVGATLPMMRTLTPQVSSGSLTLIRASSPDHAAFVVNAGAALRLTSRFRLIGDVKYEPFPSTAEVRRSTYPNDDLESSFHLLVVATGISVRF